MIKDKPLGIKAAIEAQYFPPVEFFALYDSCDQIYLLKKERFEKQSYRNRCRILASNKVQDLIVPVQKGKTQLISGEVHIIYHQNWAVLHERAIASSYGKAPYFEHYFPQVQEILQGASETIFDLDVLTIRWVERALGLNPAIILDNGANMFGGQILRSFIHPKGRSSKFEVQGSKDSSTLNFKPESLNSPYFQCFDHSGFVPNLSILDLIMNMGPESTAYLRAIELK